MERRNRLRLLQPWLEAMVSTGNTETATHNAVGKIYVTLNKDPVTFLTNNQFYDPKVGRLSQEHLLDRVDWVTCCAREPGLS